MEGDHQDLSKAQKIGRWFGARWNDVKSFFKEAPIVFLAIAGIMLTVYVAYQPAILIDKGWSHFEVFQRFSLWFLRGAIVRSVIGGLGVLALCSFVYWLKVRSDRFIVVSDFRVWGDLEKRFPAKGVAARLRDELMRLCSGARESEVRQQTMASVGAASGEQESLEVKEVLFIEGGLSLPETHVTLQYEGISLEGFLTFVRRTTKREVVLTGDLMSHDGGLLLFVRAGDDGPWEVLIENSDSAKSLGVGLQRVALHVMASLSERFQPKAASAFGLLHAKARELKEYDLGLHLARLAYNAAPTSFEAKSNLAVAHSDVGGQLGNKRDYQAAESEFEKATNLKPDFYEAYEYLGRVRKELGKETMAQEAFEKAQEIKKKLESRQPDPRK